MGRETVGAKESLKLGVLRPTQVKDSPGGICEACGGSLADKQHRDFSEGLKVCLNTVKEV